MHELAGLLDLAELLLNLGDLFAGVFQFGGHGRLGLRGDLGSKFSGVFGTVLESLRDAFQAFGDGAGDSLHFGGALRLRRGEAEHIAAHLVHLRLEGFTLFLIVREPDQDPDDESDHDQTKNDDSGQGNHFFSPESPGNSHPTLPGRLETGQWRMRGAWRFVTGDWGRAGEEVKLAGIREIPASSQPTNCWQLPSIRFVVHSFPERRRADGRIREQESFRLSRYPSP